MFDHFDSYILSDFLLFSQETYYRLFELYNRDVWPLHILCLATAGALVGLLYRRPRHALRVASFGLALAWAWVGWSFHLERYATINVAAPYFAALFGVEALLLLAIGVFADRIGFFETSAATARIGVALVLFAVFLQPFIGLAAGRAWTELSIFGLGPDPTSTATIGAFLAAKSRLKWIVIGPAVVWCLISMLTALAMDSIESVGPGLAVVAFGTALLPRRNSGTHAS